MQVVSLIPHDRTSSRNKVINVSGNVITVNGDRRDSISLECDKVYSQLKEEVADINFNQSSTFIAACTTDSFSDSGTILGTISGFARRFFELEEQGLVTKLKVVKIVENTQIDMISDEEAGLEIKNAIEVTDLAKSVLENIEKNAIIYITLFGKFRIDMMFVPTKSNGFDELDAILNTKSMEGPNCFVNIFSQAVATNKNLVIDVRFGNQCGYDDNVRALNSVEIIKKACFHLEELKVNTVTTKPSGEKQPKWREFMYGPKRIAKSDNHAKASKSKKRRERDICETKSRLVLLAKKYAYDPAATQEDLEGILQEIQDQIKDSEMYHAQVEETIGLLNQDVKISREEEKRLAKNENKLKQHLMELKTYHKTDETARESIMIGDNDDYTIAYECLKEEIDTVEGELEFLRLAFPDLKDGNNEEEEGNVY